MKKTLATIMAMAVLAMPIMVRADADSAEKPYGGTLEYVKTLCHTTAFKVEGEKGAVVPEGAVEYTELIGAEYGQKTMLIRRVMDYNGDGIFNGNDYYTDAETKEGDGKDPVKGQNILNELKSYFLPKTYC